MKKNLLIFLSCIGICTCAYRFGDISWSEAKYTIMKELHSGITQFMLPMVTLYDIPEGYLICQDVGGLVMPILDKTQQHSVATDSSMKVDENNSASTENETTNTGILNSEVLNTEGQEPTEPNSSEMEEQTVDVGVLSVLERQVVINRQKLQDFDYLRQNFYQVDNSTTIGSDLLDVNKLLEKNLTIAEIVEGPQILIYHTHSQEGYADSTPGDASTSVVAVGEYLTQLLTEQYGMQVLHHTGQYDVGDHANAYANALPAIKEILAENPSIEVVIDLHRDGVPATTHLVTEINGKQTAQIMFFNGLSRTTSKGELTYLNNPYIEDNLAFSFQMQLAAAECYPGLTRRIYLKGYRYNMHVCPKTMLVEVGAQTNTFEEAKNAMEPLAALLAEVLK